MGVIAKGIPRGCQDEYPLCHGPWDTHYQFSMKTLLSMKDNLFVNHVTQVCEVHDQVILSFLQKVQGPARPTTERSRESIGHNVHV